MSSAGGRRLAQVAKAPRSPAVLAYKPRAAFRSPQPDSAVSPAKVSRYRRLPLYFGLTTCLFGGFYIVGVYQGYRRDAESATARNVPLDVSDRYKRTAEHYDQDVDWMEWIMGITKLRKQLVEKAQGNVLEVSVGTGRNAPHYPLTKGVKNITMVDQSAEMIREARTNWPKTCAYFINASFRVQSAADPIPCPSPEGFDTIVQTMGVCSTTEPEKVLKNLGTLCKQDTGRILLLEHGRGYYDWLNTLLDNIAPAHADRHGCWFNKDIGEIVERSGLEIVEAKRFHFGTTWWYELKAPKRLPVVLESAGNEQNDSTPTSTQAPWWASFWR